MLHRQARANAQVVQEGFSLLVGRATPTRDDSTIHVHEAATELETLHVLEFIARIMGG